MISVTGITLTPLAFILEHLRPEDREEIEAVRGPFEPLDMARKFCMATITRSGWLFWDYENGPIAALGVYSMTPTCAGVWAFATPDWPLVYRSVTKHVRRIMVPRLLAAGFHRAECRALSSREDTRRWLLSLGARAEAVLSEFGTRREDFTLFAWTADEQAHHHGRLAGPSRVPLRHH